MKDKSFFVKGLILMLILSSCATHKSIIPIGFVGGLTGSGSNLSVDAMYGALLAVDNINEAGGVMNRQFKLIIENDESNPQKAISVDQSLIDQGCKFIIGHMISSMAESAIPFITEHKVLMISPTIALDDFSGIDDNFIRVIPSNITQADLLSSVVVSAKLKRFAILYSKQNIQFANSFLDSIAGKASAESINLVGTFTFDSEAVLDYELLINQFKQSQIDGLLLIASGDEAAAFAQFFDLMDYHPTVFLPAWAMTQDLIVRGGRGVEDFFGVNYIQIDSKEAEYISFKAQYEAKYGYQPTFSAIMAYEAVLLLANAITATQSLDPMIVKKEITSNSTYRGLYGDLAINKFGDATRKISLFQIKNGQFESVVP